VDYDKAIGQPSKLGSYITCFDHPGYIILTGTARSGTTYISRVFQSLGLDIRHEKYGEKGISAFQLAPFLSFYRHALIIHQVREPLACISSIQTIRSRTWRRVACFLSDLSEENYISCCMRYWLDWNAMIEPHACYRYQVEKIEEHWEWLCEHVGIPKCELPAIPTDTNSRKHLYEGLTWEDIREADEELYDSIRYKAQEYGY